MPPRKAGKAPVVKKIVVAAVVEAEGSVGVGVEVVDMSLADAEAQGGTVSVYLLAGFTHSLGVGRSKDCGADLNYYLRALRKNEYLYCLIYQSTQPQNRLHILAEQSLDSHPTQDTQNHHLSEGEGGITALDIQEINDAIDTAQAEAQAHAHAQQEEVHRLLAAAGAQEDGYQEEGAGDEHLQQSAADHLLSFATTSQAQSSQQNHSHSNNHAHEIAMAIATLEDPNNFGRIYAEQNMMRDRNEERVRGGGKRRSGGERDEQEMDVDAAEGEGEGEEEYRVEMEYHHPEHEHGGAHLDGMNLTLGGEANAVAEIFANQSQHQEEDQLAGADGHAGGMSAVGVAMSAQASGSGSAKGPPRKRKRKEPKELNEEEKVQKRAAHVSRGLFGYKIIRAWPLGDSLEWY